MWYEDISNDSDVVISTRLRYARNIAGYKFPHMMNNNEQAKIIKLIENVKLKDNYKLFKMKDIDVDTENSLMEKHLISKEFVGNDDGAIIASDKYDILCMINEEDHLRIQSFESGFNPDKAYNNPFSVGYDIISFFLTSVTAFTLYLESIFPFVEFGSTSSIL